MLCGLGSRHPVRATQPSQVLYNGITLGTPWPPRLKYPDEHLTIPAYLTDPPAVIPIDVGRQLFVDDFLISETNLVRTCHHATYHADNPVLRPETPWEFRDDAAERTNLPPNPAAMVFSDGVFFDPRDGLFKMWYMGGYGGATCLATSLDGISWRRPDFAVVPGTNIVNTAGRDSSTVWLDQFEPDPRRRFKMAGWHNDALVLWTSSDGVHWTEIGASGRAADRSTFFHNPFRQVWVFSLRGNENEVSGRYRRYWETARFADAPDWGRQEPVAWVKADSSDFARPGVADRPELYNLDCVAYESVMLGLFSVWRGESGDREKINEIAVGFSRDGFHWYRPDRQSFLSVSEAHGSWNWANVQSAGGCCLIVGDRLHFYVSGRQGRPGTNAPGVCSTGLATLRRDGFASMDWRPEDGRARRVIASAPEGGALTTRVVTFDGSHLFINADLGDGELRVEMLDRNGGVIAPFTRDACIPTTGDGTRLAVRWQGAALGDLAGRPVRFRFSLSHGRLYAFWVSRWPTGESHGYPAAGGPEFTGPIDDGGA